MHICVFRAMSYYEVLCQSLALDNYTLFIFEVVGVLLPTWQLSQKVGRPRKHGTWSIDCGTREYLHLKICVCVYMIIYVDMY